MQVSHLLPDRDELYGHPDLVGDGERDAALRAVPSSLVRMMPVTPYGLGEHLGLPQPVLARRRVHGHQHLVRSVRYPALYDPPTFSSSAIRLTLVCSLPGRVYEQHVRAALPGLFDRVVGDRRRVRAPLAGDHRGPGPLAPGLELLDGRRPKGVSGGEALPAPGR